MSGKSLVENGLRWTRATPSAVQGMVSPSTGQGLSLPLPSAGRPAPWRRAGSPSRARSRWP